MAKYIKSMSVGIDLGTTSSVVSILENEGANIRVLDIADSNNRHTKRATLFRSAVNVKHDLVGPEADTDEFRSTSFFNLKKKFIESANQVISNSSRGEITPYLFQQKILNKLFDKSIPLISSDEDFEIKLENVTVTVPTDFKTSHRKIMLDLINSSKWGVAKQIHIIDEPIAASMAKIHSNPSIEGLNWITYDLGGGTFDVSLLETIDLEDKKVHKVHINRGDLDLGGYQLDEVIWSLAKDSILEESTKTKMNLDPKFEKELKTSFIDNCGEIKMMLDSEPDYTDVLKIKTKKYGTHIITVSISQKEYWEKILPFLERTLSYSQEIMDFALENNLKVSGINFVGGSTKDPHIRKYIQKNLKIENSYFVKPEEAVSMGAAIKSGIEDKGMSKITSAIMDSVSSPIGFTKIDGTIQWILSEGDPLPTTKTFRVGGVVVGQTGVAFSFVESSKMYYCIEQLQGDYYVSKELEISGFAKQEKRPIFVIEVQIDEDKIANIRIMQEGTSIIKTLPSHQIFNHSSQRSSSDRKDSIRSDALKYVEEEFFPRGETKSISKKLKASLEELTNIVEEQPDIASSDELLALAAGAHDALQSQDESEMSMWLYRVLSQADLL